MVLEICDRIVPKPERSEFLHVNRIDRYFEVSHCPRATERDIVWRVLGEWLQRRYIQRDATILDLGAGYGAFINNIAGAVKYALDRSPVIIRYANKDVQVLVGDCADLAALRAELCDVVFASNLLEHLTHDHTERVLQEVSRVLKPGGRLILLQPNFAYAYRNYFDDFTHQQIFTHSGLSDLLRFFDFEIEAVYPKFMPFSMRQGIPVAGWLVRLYLLSPWKPRAGQMLLVARKPANVER